MFLVAQTTVMKHRNTRNKILNKILSENLTPIMRTV